MVKKKTKQQYRINNTKEAKEVSTEYLKTFALDKAILFGLPEIDDRYHIWRVPLLNNQKGMIGEIVIDAITSRARTVE